MQSFKNVHMLTIHTDRPTSKGQIKGALLRGKTNFCKRLTLQKHINQKRKTSFYQRKVKGLQETDSRKWWQHIKSMMRLSKVTSPLQGLANEQTDGCFAALAEKVNLFVQSASARLPPLTADCSFLRADVPYLPDKYVIRPEEVERRLLRLKVNKATGWDGIPAWVLRDFAPYLAGRICAIFNNSLREGCLPELWKTADVVPLPKKTPPTEVDSHLRPISLTPVLSKVLESFTREWIKETTQYSINPRQYGAISCSSTTHALIEMLHFILSSLEKRSHHARTLLFDYSKTFDSVNHHILLQKLHEAGSPAILTRWVAASCSIEGEDRRPVFLLADSQWGDPSRNPLWSLVIHCAPGWLLHAVCPGLHLCWRHFQLHCLAQNRLSSNAGECRLRSIVGQEQWHET